VATIGGTSKSDTLNGGSGADTINGFAGDTPSTACTRWPRWISCF